MNPLRRQRSKFNVSSVYVKCIFAYPNCKYIPSTVESRGFRCKVSVYLSSLRWYSLCRSSPWCKENGLGPRATGHRVSSNPASLLRLIFQHSSLSEAKKEITMFAYSELDFFLIINIHQYIIHFALFKFIHNSSRLMIS